MKYEPQETDLYDKKGFIIRIYKWDKDTETQLKVETFIDKEDYALCTKERLGQILQDMIAGKRP